MCVGNKRDSLTSCTIRNLIGLSQDVLVAGFISKIGNR